MTRPRAWVCWSSGKDSAWALHVARAQGEADAVALMPPLPEPYQRVSMHGVRMSLVRAQAREAGLPLHEVPIPAPCPNEVYEARMAEAMQRARAEEVTHIVFGDLFLQEVRAYREANLARVGMTPVFPLWGRTTWLLAREMLAGGLRAHLVCIDPRQMPRGFAGGAFDWALLATLPASVDPCGEKGEFHTLAWDGPMFSRPIPVRVGETVEREGFVFTDLVPV